MVNPAKDHAAEKLLRDKEKQAALDRKDIDAFIAEGIKLPQGKKFFWWLFELGKVGRNPFNGNALGTSFACGELNVGQQILARVIEVNAAGYVQLLKERQDEYDARRQPVADDDSDPADRD